LKIRNGFVSNSSSSSFILAWKGDLKKELEKAFGFKKEYPIQFKGNDFVKKFIEAISFTENGISIKDLHDQYGDDDEDWPNHQVLKWMNDGYKVGLGDFSDDRDDVETFLCNSEIQWDKENLKIIKEVGY
jgi:hypothetical protein